MGVAVWLQFLRLVRMAVRAMLSRVLVFVLLRIACLGMCVRMLMLMFVFVDMVVFMSVRNPIVGVLMGMGVGVIVLMLMAMIVLTFHRISLQLARLARDHCDTKGAESAPLQAWLRSTSIGVRSSRARPCRT